MRNAKVYVSITAFQELQVIIDDNETEEDAKDKVLLGEFEMTGGLEKVKMDMDKNNMEVELE